MIDLPTPGRTRGGARGRQRPMTLAAAYKTSATIEQTRLICGDVTCYFEQRSRS
jgi:hypothetical protein